MKLLPVDDRHCDIAAAWLNEESNRQWLDFGNARLNPLALRVMTQKPAHRVRLFTNDEESRPIGIVALSEIHARFRTAQIWYVLGDKEYSGKGCASRAVSLLLQEAFAHLELRAVNAWTVEHNRASISVLVKSGFRACGRIRSAHEIDGRVYDRLLFDLLAEEYGRRHASHSEP